MNKLVMLGLTAMLFGCGGDEAETTKQKKGTVKSDVEDVVDTMVGGKALRNGRRAEDQIRQIQTDYNRKLDQVLDDTD